MRNTGVFGWLSLLILAAAASAQQATINPQVRTKPTADHKITTIELTAHFVTTIRVPEPVNSVVVGDPALFQVEHSEHEPELVFVKALTTEDAESNLLISTAKGRQISFLLVSHGRGASPAKVDFLLRYQTAGGFLIEPEAVPFALVAQTTGVSKPQSPAAGPIAHTAQSSGTLVPAAFNPTATQEASSQAKPDSLDSLLERQKQAPLPVLYGERMEGDEVKGDRLRTGISEVLDGGQSGVRIDPTDYKAAASQLAQLLENWTAWDEAVEEQIAEVSTYSDRGYESQFVKLWNSVHDNSAATLHAMGTASAT